jgi:hypothetical protein
LPGDYEQALCAYQRRDLRRPSASFDRFSIVTEDAQTSGRRISSRGRDENRRFDEAHFWSESTHSTAFWHLERGLSPGRMQEGPGKL